MSSVTWRRIRTTSPSRHSGSSRSRITGIAPAECGGKTSLIVQILTESGPKQPKPTGRVWVEYGSFKKPTVDVNVGGGSQVVGNFVSVSAMRSDRFLDPPELDAIHDA